MIQQKDIIACNCEALKNIQSELERYRNLSTSLHQEIARLLRDIRDDENQPNLDEQFEQDHIN